MNDRIISDSGRFFTEIYPDDDAENPRNDWFSFGTVVTGRLVPFAGDEVVDSGTWRKPADSIALPLYYSYGSGQVWTGDGSELPLRGFGDGQVGVIYATRSRAREVLGDDVTDDQIRGALDCEVEAYSQYLVGDVWCYVIWKTPDGMDPEYVDTDRLEPCNTLSGLYGYDYAAELVESELAAMDRMLVK